MKIIEARGTGLWLDPSIPHRGWTCIDINDLGEPAFTCEMCQVQVIRYVHTMTHPSGRCLQTGCVCAGHMEGNPRQAWIREASFKGRQERRKRWLSRPWRLSGQGNHYLNADGFNVVVFQNGRSWAARLEHRMTGQVRFSQIPYETQDAAKLAAFNAMLGMKQKIFR